MTPDVTYALWDSVAPPGRPDCVSLPTQLSGNQESLFRRYVDWRDGLSQGMSGGKRLADALDLSVAGGGALWWASTIAATPVESLGRVADILKLAALEEWAQAATFDRLIYSGHDRQVVRVLRDWCKRRSCEFSAEPGSQGSPSSTPERPARELPHLLDAVRYLRAFFRRRRLLGPWRSVQRTQENTTDLVIATFFPNIDLSAAEDGRFESRYWGRMHALISELQVGVRWIWSFSASSQMSLAAAVRLRDRLNERSSRTRQSFSFLEEEVGPADLLRAIKTYFRLIWCGLRFRKLKHSFQFPKSAIDFFPLLKRDWYSSFFGAHAMYMALYSAACRSALQGRRTGTAGMMYLWENQCWEYLLLDSWKAAHSSPAFGVAHTPAGSSPAVLRNRLGRAQRAAISVLGPDRLIAGGGGAVGALKTYGWEQGRVSEAEALRYEHLVGRRDVFRRELPTSGLQLLVLTGIVPFEARFVLDLLADADRLGALDRYACVRFKPHPFCRIDHLVANLRLQADIKIVDGPIDGLCQQSDVVVSGLGTSAWIEVAWLGVPLIVIEALDRLYPTPIPLAEGRRAAQTVASLVDQLRDPQRIIVDDSLFTFSPDLVRWRAFLHETLRVSMQQGLRPSPERL